MEAQVPPDLKSDSKYKEKKAIIKIFLSPHPLIWHISRLIRESPVNRQSGVNQNEFLCVFICRLYS